MNEEFDDSDFIDEYMQKVNLEAILKKLPDSVKMESLRADVLYKTMIEDYLKSSELVSKNDVDWAYKQKEQAKKIYQMSIDFLKEPIDTKDLEIPEGKDYYYNPETNTKSFFENINIINDKIIEENKTPDPPPFEPYIK